MGKSTLTNAMVGEKVAITSSKPQTTRRAIRGIAHYANGQLILVDTPGMHRPRTLLGERLNSIVQTTLGDVDVVAFCMPANEKIGPGDRYINEQLDNGWRDYTGTADVEYNGRSFYDAYAGDVPMCIQLTFTTPTAGGRGAAARGVGAARLGGDHSGVGDQPYSARYPGGAAH